MPDNTNTNDEKKDNNTNDTSTEQKEQVDVNQVVKNVVEMATQQLTNHFKENNPFMTDEVKSIAEKLNQKESKSEGKSKDKNTQNDDLIARMKALEDVNAKLKEENKITTVKNAVIDAASKSGVHNPDQLFTIIKSCIDFEDGTIRIKDSKGDTLRDNLGNPLTVTDYLSKLKEDNNYSYMFKSNSVGGIDAAGNVSSVPEKQITGEDILNMSSDEFNKFIKNAK